MLRTYLYPAVANEILLSKNELTEADVRATDKAIADMAEFSTPLSLHKSVAHDLAVQSEEDGLLSKIRNVITIKTNLTRLKQRHVLTNMLGGYAQGVIRGRLLYGIGRWAKQTVRFVREKKQNPVLMT